MNLGSCNIRNFPDMPASKVAQDARTVARYTTLAGLQEIRPGDDTHVVADGLEESGHTWWMVGGGRETPIVGRADRWDVVDHHQVPIHRPHGLPRPQNAFPAVTSVIVQSVKRRHLPEFAVVNVHLISGAMNGPKLPELRSQWHEEWSMYQAEVGRLHQLKLTVFTVGDLNNPVPPPLRPTARFKWLSPIGAPDHLGQLRQPGGTYLARHSHRAVAINSDHDLHVISGPLTATAD